MVDIWKLSPDELARAVADGDVDVATRDEAGQHALHRVIPFGASLEMVEALLGGDPGLNDQDYQGWTPLHFAADQSRADLVQLLVDRGADIHVQDSHGKTPLGRAVFAAGRADSNADAVEVLLKAGADPDIPNNNGVTPRQLAHTIADNDDVLRLLSP